MDEIPPTIQDRSVQFWGYVVCAPLEQSQWNKMWWVLAGGPHGVRTKHLSFKIYIFLISNAVFSHKTLHNSCQLLLTFYTSFMAYLMQQLFLGSTLYSFSVGEWILISYRFWVGKDNNLAGFPVLWNFTSTDGRFWPFFSLQKCSSGKFS